MINFKAYLENIGITINDEQLNKFNIYYNCLVETNKVMNLTAITEETEVYIKHFYDSLLLAKCVDCNEASLLDVGSGAGFPSIPLAIMFPTLKVTIIDSLNKRINFLNSLITKLELKNVVAIHARAEEFAKNNRESFDIVTARAVARLNVLAELCVPLVKLDGKFISLKGNDKSELKEATVALNTLGVALIEENIFELPLNMGERTIYTFVKVKATPLKYPRLFKDIKNKPL